MRNCFWVGLGPPAHACCFAHNTFPFARALLLKSLVSCMLYYTQKLPSRVLCRSQHLSLCTCSVAQITACRACSATHKSYPRACCVAHITFPFEHALLLKSSPAVHALLLTRATVAHAVSHTRPTIMHTVPLIRPTITHTVSLIRPSASLHPKSFACYCNTGQRGHASAEPCLVKASCRSHTGSPAHPKVMSKQVVKNRHPPLHRSQQGLRLLPPRLHAHAGMRVQHLQAHGRWAVALLIKGSGRGPFAVWGPYPSVSSTHKVCTENQAVDGAAHQDASAASPEQGGDQWGRGGRARSLPAERLQLSLLMLLESHGRFLSQHELHVGWRRLPESTKHSSEPSLSSLACVLCTAFLLVVRAPVRPLYSAGLRLLRGDMNSLSEPRLQVNATVST